MIKLSDFLASLPEDEQDKIDERAQEFIRKMLEETIKDDDPDEEIENEPEFEFTVDPY